MLSGYGCYKRSSTFSMSYGLVQVWLFEYLGICVSEDLEVWVCCKEGSFLALQGDDEDNKDVLWLVVVTYKSNQSEYKSV